ncbi:unnamed protein product [Fusarium langsethiae]|nr:unnamed protein product [Fusarium langsethiae]
MWSSIRRSLAALAIFQATLCLALLLGRPSHTKEIPQQTKGHVNAVYFTNWGIYGRNFQPQDLPASHITQVLFAFLNVKPDGTVYTGDIYADLEKHYEGDRGDDQGDNAYGCVKQLFLLKKVHRHLKVIMSVGGWTWSTNFPSAASTRENRIRFSKSAVTLMKDWGFDGIDVDWEYPNDDNEATNFDLLLQAIRDELDLYASQNAPSHHFLLSIAAPAGPEKYNKLHLANISNVVDQINIMAYDYSGSWDSASGHNANLFPYKASVNPYNSDEAINDYIEAGVPTEKIVLGMPIYGRSFEENLGIGKSFSDVGQGSWERGVWDYKALPKPGAEIEYDEEAQAYYSYDPTTHELISYDTPEVVEKKVGYVLRHGLGGMRRYFTQWHDSFPSTTTPFYLFTLTSPPYKSSFDKHQYFPIIWSDRTSYCQDPRLLTTSTSTRMFQVPPRHPRSTRRKCDEVLQPPSPSDSGYGSSEDVSEYSHNTRKRYFPSFDGSGPDSAPMLKLLENEEQIPPSAKQKKFQAGIPKTPGRHHPRQKPSVVSPFICPQTPKYLPLQDKRIDNNRSLDRYVPRRDFVSPSSERYRTTKQSQDLSREERLKRNKSASADPFVLKRRVLDPDPRFPFRVDDTGQDRGVALGQLLQNRGGERQVSMGAMWSVGGVAPSTIAVDDGQGHLIRRGTNARLFPTPFQEGLVSTSVEKEKHEGRIASALKIDQVRKILEFAENQQIPRGLRYHAWQTESSQTSWNGYQWANREKWSAPTRPARQRLLPAAPFRVLDAPNLKDDFYCSPLAYSATTHTLVICLGSMLYAWNPLIPGAQVQTEDLVVGDEMGNIYYYVVEWPIGWEITRNTWPGAVSLIARISNIHCQQVCGLAWSHDGRLFASGGNDNLCCLFDAEQVVGRRLEHTMPGNGYRARVEASSAYGGIETRVTQLISLPRSEDGFAAQLRLVPNATDAVRCLGPSIVKHHWNHEAAVKAIAFCPWRRGLVATGGGSNDKCIHFFHTPSGAALATISVSAQVTSLIWNTTRREIAATFGYPSPEHPYRVSVFSWPECRQVAAIPWEDDLRALYAIAYPRGPTYGDPTVTGGGQEGCIVVASSDRSIKFHEVWSREKGVAVGATGILAGSDILEGLEGIDKEGDIIR